jgi:rhodanese-related sulfurtransferase
MPFVVALVAGVLVIAACLFIRGKRQQQRVIDSHIAVGDLNNRIKHGERLTIVDLRHPLDVLASPQVIPGATHMDPAQVERKSEEIPLDANIVLYCTCPNEETSMRVLGQLRKRGFRHVRALSGGLPKWKEAGLPVQELYPEIQDKIRKQHSVS